MSDLPWWFGLTAAQERLIRRLDGLPPREPPPEPEHVYWCSFPEFDCICPAPEGKT